MFLSFFLYLNSALALTPEQVLKTAWTDKTYLAHDGIQDTDSKNPFRSVDAFYSYERNGDAESEVGLKFNLKSYPEWNSGRSRSESNQTLKESTLAWALRDRYAVLVGYELGAQKLKSVDRFIETAEKHLQAQTLALRAMKTSAKNFLESKEELLGLKRTKSLLLEEREILKKKLERWSLTAEASELESFDLLEVEDIVLGLQGPGLSQTLTGRLAKEEIQQMDQELQIVRGREKQWVKSFDLSQTTKKEEHLFEFGVSIQLPPLGSDDWIKQRQNELILKMALKQRDLENMSDRLRILRFQIQNAIDLYKLSRANQVITNRSKSLDPLMSFQAKIASHKEQLEVLNQRQSILTLYLEYLLESETLSKAPETNHLSRTRKPIL